MLWTVILVIMEDLILPTLYHHFQDGYHLRLSIDSQQVRYCTEKLGLLLFRPESQDAVFPGN